MNAIIIEDSRLARVELKELLSCHSDIKIIGEAENYEQGVNLIDELKPDVVFLDIQLPGKDGFSILEAVEHVPQVIFTTAYDEYAIKSFEYNALGYLLKPIRKERLAHAITKLSTAPKEKSEDRKLEGNSRIFIKDGEQCWLVDLVDIELFESCGNYTCVHFKAVKPLIHKSLSKIENRLNVNQFFRVNRQYIVNLNFIKNIELWVGGNYRLTMNNDIEIEVSRSHSTRLKNLLSI